MLTYCHLNCLKTIGIETFFSSVRQRRGFNNNPSCKQFKSAYKKLLDHSEISDSQYGNCVAILDSTKMSVVNVGPDFIINNNNEEELHTVEQDHDYKQFLSRLSPFLNEVTSYIAGFVVKKFLKKVVCNVCYPFLIDCSNHNLKLIMEKDRNNALIKPSRDVVEICQEAERIFRFYNVFLPNINHKMFNKIKHKIYQKPNIFDELNVQCKGQQLFNTHRDQIISLAILTYLYRYSFSPCCWVNRKKNSISMRKKFTKIVLFRNELQEKIYLFLFEPMFKTL